MKLISIFTIIITLQTNFAFAKKIKLAYVNFPPYEYQIEKKPVGILIEIVQEIFKRAHTPLELVILPFKRGKEDVKKGKLDGIFNFYKIPERLKYFDYSEPIIENPLVFFVQRNSEIKYNSLKNLKGLKIGVIRGYTYGSEFDKSILFKKDPVNSHKSNLVKLYYGRIDAYPVDKLVGIHVASKNKILDSFKILKKPLKIMLGHIGFSKGKHLKLIKKIDNIILDMKKINYIEKIIDDYVERSFDEKK